MPEDKLAISGSDQKASVKEALKKALKYDGDSDNKVLIAIEDNKILLELQITPTTEIFVLTRFICLKTAYRIWAENHSCFKC